MGEKRTVKNSYLHDDGCFYIAKNIAGFGTLLIYNGCRRFYEPISPRLCIKTIFDLKIDGAKLYAIFELYNSYFQIMKNRYKILFKMIKPFFILFFNHKTHFIWIL